MDADVIAGRFEVLERLRDSSFGPVYRVRHTSLESVLILKELSAALSSDPEVLARFKQNARLTVRLRHESIARVLDIVSDASRHFIVEEFIPAATLRTVLDARGVLALERAVGIGRQVAGALGHAHAAGSIHGSLSPRSILVDDEFARPAVLTDLGMAGILTPSPDGDPYAAPELSGGASSGGGPRIDVYSLGAVLFEMCEGRPPAPDEAAPDRLPAGIADAIARAIRRDPTERFANVAQLSDALGRSAAATQASDITIIVAPPVKDIRIPGPVVASAVALEPEPDDDVVEESTPAPAEEASAADDRPAPLEEPSPAEALHIEPEEPVPAEPPRIEDFPPWLPARPERSYRTPVSVVAVAAVVVAAILYLAWPPSAPSPPTLPPALAWQDVVPTQPDVALAAGAALRLRAGVVAADRRPDLEYVWRVDGREQGRGPTLEYRPTDGSAHDVSVRASAGEETLERTWRVTVLAPPPSPAEPVEQSAAVTPEPVPPEPPAAPPVANALEAPPAAIPPPNRPPTITRATPRPGTPLTIVAGGAIEFAVRASDPDKGDATRYRWLLDGRVVGTAATWRFVAPDESVGERHRIEVAVTDLHGAEARPETWSVDVRPALTLTRARPGTERVAIPFGQRAEFSITPPAGDLTYSWSVDDRPVATSADGQFRLPGSVPVGAHQVSVVAADGAGTRSKATRWLLDILGSSPSSDRITEAEVRDWLARFRNAWQSKDVTTLRSLGVVTSDRQEVALRRSLSQLHGLRVNIRNETIVLAGDQATLSFDRVDSEAVGTVIPQGRQVFHLERSATGLVAVPPGRGRP